MTTETIETPATPADPEVPTEETETPAEVESAAPEAEPAAVPQVEVAEAEKPDYMTRSDWEREKAEVSQRAAADALEADRRRRQTENARRAKQEADDLSSRQEAVDTLRAALGAKGIYEVPDEAAFTAIDRIASKKAERMSANSFDTVEQAWDYLTAPAYGKSVDLDDSFEPAARRLGPKLQHLVDQIRPAIEAQARKGYIAESELPKRIEQFNAAKAAKSREGQEELKHVEGTSSAVNQSRESLLDRIAYGVDKQGNRLTQADKERYQREERGR